MSLSPSKSVVAHDRVWGLSAWLQDHFLPYCADPRHPGDSFFIICEEDFRLTKRDSEAMPCTQLAEARRIVQEADVDEVFDPYVIYDIMDEDVFVSSDEIFNLREKAGKADPNAQYTFADGTGMSKEWSKSFGQFFTKHTAPGPARHVPEALADLVKIAICADRNGVGDFIWYSWEGSNKRGSRSRPMHGATMIGISVEGARKLLSLMSSGRLAKGHADLVLRNYMEQHGKEFKACYCYPSVGHYQSHISGCAKGLGWRQNHWDRTWIQEGTRKNPVQPTNWAAPNEHRYLVHFRDSGVSDWITQVMLPEPLGAELRWLTYDDTEAMDSTEEGALTSPRGFEETVGSKGKGKESRRQKRQRRRNDTLRKYRNWTSSWQEVVL